MGPEANNELLGRWTTDPHDVKSLQEFGQVTLVFSEGGHLRYIIHGEKKDEIIILKYSVKDGMLVTDQPSQPRQERTPMLITHEGKLVLGPNGDQSVYIRTE